MTNRPGRNVPAPARSAPGTGGTGHRLSLTVAATALAIALGAPAARAEPVSVIYLGFSVTGDAPYTVNGLPLPPSLFCVQDCSSAKSAVGGVRVGYFFERFPWLGVAGDVSAWVTGWGIQSPYEVTVYPITPLAIVRARLVEREGYENGRVQPYVAIGPGIFVSTAEVTSGYLILGNTLSASTTTADVGLDVRAGMELLPTDWFGVTIEYRYAYVAPSYTIEGQRIETTFSTNQVSLGLVVHY